MIVVLFTYYTRNKSGTRNIFKQNQKSRPRLCSSIFFVFQIEVWIIMKYALNNQVHNLCQGIDNIKFLTTRFWTAVEVWVQLLNRRTMLDHDVIKGGMWWLVNEWCYPLLIASCRAHNLWILNNQELSED